MEITIRDDLHEDAAYYHIIYDRYVYSTKAVNAYQGLIECVTLLDTPAMPEWQKRRQQSAVAKTALLKKFRKAHG